MMERIIIIPDRFDLSEIAEAIVYYSHVEILVNHADICYLLESIGIDNTIRLAESDIITLLYERTHSVIYSNEFSYLPHSIANISFSHDKRGQGINSVFEELDSFIRLSFGNGVIPLDKVRRLSNAINERDCPSTRVHAASLSDIADSEFLNKVIKIGMAQHVPDYPNIDRISCKSIVENESFYIQGNIDFDLANSLYNIKGPDNIKLFTYQKLVAPILKMRSEMYHSGDRNCDIFTSDLNSKVFTYRVNSFLDRITKPSENINRFQDFKLQGRSFSSALSSGDISIIDVLEFAESLKTREFKSWLNSLKANSDILSQYEIALRESPITSTLPYKTLKFTFMSALGYFINPLSTLLAANPVISGLLSDIAVESLDDFFLSKLKTGWKPNQWVFESANKFLSNKKIGSD